MILRHLLPLAAVVFVSGPAQSAETLGTGAEADWQRDAPGQRHRITVDSLPVPNPGSSSKNAPKVVAAPEGAALRVPAGFSVERYAAGFKNPRHLATAPNGDIFVVESEPGVIRVLHETSGNGVPDQNVVFATGLTKPFGLAFYPPGPEPQYIYVGNTDSVVRLPYRNGDLKATGEPQKIADLPAGGQLTGGGHWTRDVTFSSDGKRLFASIGSKSNVDEEGDAVENERARIISMNPEGGDRTPYATGLRNPVSLAIHPVTGELWSSVNERDELGDDLVPDYITRIQPGGFYGWPWSYFGIGQDSRASTRRLPKPLPKVTKPDVLIQAHSAALGVAFYTGDAFPSEYRQSLFVALHGSWNRTVRTGYKVIRVSADKGKPADHYEDFLTGFVLSNDEVWGRPVGLCVTKDGALLVSEDGNNTIWRISAKRP